MGVTLWFQLSKTGRVPLRPAARLCPQAIVQGALTPWSRIQPALQREVREQEPHIALSTGPSRLDVYGRLIEQARTVLRPAGWLLSDEEAHALIQGAF